MASTTFPHSVGCSESQTALDCRRLPHSARIGQNTVAPYRDPGLRSSYGAWCTSQRPPPLRISSPPRSLAGHHHPSGFLSTGTPPLSLSISPTLRSMVQARYLQADLTAARGAD